MKITPIANNAIEIALEDGSVFRLHHSISGNREQLFISAENGVVISSMIVTPQLGWELILDTKHLIRIIAKRNLEQS